MAITKKQADLISQAFGRDVGVPVEEMDTQIVETPSYSPQELRDQFARLDYKQRDEIIGEAYAHNGKFVLPSYMKDERGWDKFSGLELDESYVKNLPKFYTEEIRAPKKTGFETVSDEELRQRASSGDLMSQLQAETELQYRAKQPKDLGQQYMMAEQARLDNERQLRMLQRQREAGVDTLVRMRATQGTEGDTNIFNEFNKAFLRATQQAGGALAGAVEGFAPSDAYWGGIHNWAEAQADAVRSEILKSPELNKAKSIKSFTEGGWADPNYYAATLGGVIPHVAGSMTASVLGGIAGSAAGPTGVAVGAGAGAYGYSASMEAGTLYNEMLDKGYSMQDARKASALYGGIAGAMDAVVPARIGGKLLSKEAQALLNEGAKETAKKTLLNSGKNALVTIGTEGGTEAAQQLAQNITMSFYDENQDIWENVIDSFVGGAIGGTVFAGGEMFIDKANEGSFAKPNIPGQEEAAPSEEFAPRGVEKNPAQEAQQLEEKERQLQATLALGEKMQEKYPENENIANILSTVEEELSRVATEKQVVANEYRVQNSEPVISTNELRALVAQDMDGQYTGSVDITIGNTTQVLPLRETYDTRDEAELGLLDTINKFIAQQTQRDDITDAELSQLLTIQQQASPLATQMRATELMKNEPQAVLIARDTPTLEAFQKTRQGKRLMAAGVDVNQFYTVARSKTADYITAQETERIVQDLAGDLGVSVQFVQHLTTPQGKRALGSFVQAENLIKIVSKLDTADIDARTPYHEVGHAYFRTVMNEDQKRSTLDEVKDNYREKDGKELSDKEAEEILVEDLKKYKDKKDTFTVRYGKFLGALIEFFKNFTRWLGSEPKSKVEQFYKDVLSKKRPSERRGYKGDDEYVVYRTTEKKEEMSKELVALHNISLEKLEKAVELGGFPVPSIAVTKRSIPFTKFGSITFVGGEGLVSPELHSRNRVFTADAYSKRMPEEFYVIDTKTAREVYSLMMQGLPQELQVSSDEILRDLVSKTGITPERFEEKAWGSPAFLAAYLKENGKNIPIEYKSNMQNLSAFEKILAEENIDEIKTTYADYEKGTSLHEKITALIGRFVSKLSKESNVPVAELLDDYRNIFYNEDGSLKFGYMDSMIYNVKRAKRTPTEIDIYETRSGLQKVIPRNMFQQWITDKFGSVFGMKYFLENERTRKPYTLENVTRESMGHVRGQEGDIFAGGFSATVARMSKTLKSTADIKKKSTRLVTRQEGELIYNELDTAYYELGGKMNNTETSDYIGKHIQLRDAFVAYSRKAKTESSMKSSLENFSFTPSKEDVSEAKKIADAMLTMPVDYFEAKPQRVVDFDEFVGVVAPEEEVDSVKKLLSGTTLKNKVYGYKDDNHRFDLVNDIIEDTNVAFREEHKPILPVPLSQKDQNMVESMQVATANAATTEMTKENAEKFYEFTKGIYQLEQYLLSTYGVGFPGEMMEQVAQIEDRTLAHIQEAILEKTIELNPETSYKPFKGDMAKFLAREVYPILEKNTKKRREMAELGIADIVDRLTKMSNDGQLTPAQQQVLYKLEAYEDEVKTLLHTNNTQVVETFMQDIVAESNQYIGKRTSELEGIEQDLKTIEKEEKNIVQSKVMAEKTLQKLVEARISLIESQEQRARKDSERNVKRRLAQSVGMKDRSKLVVTTESELLKQKLKAEKKGADAAAIQTRKIITEKHREEKRRETLIGKIKALRTRVKKSATTGNRYAVEYTKKLLEILEEIDDARMSDKTLNKLMDIDQIISEDPFASDAIKKWYSATMKRVTKKAIPDMTFEELVVLYEALSALAERGKLELEMLKYATEEEKARRIALVIEGTKNLDPAQAKGTTRKSMGEYMKKVGNKVLRLKFLSPIAAIDQFDGDAGFSGANVAMGKTLQRSEAAFNSEYHPLLEQVLNEAKEMKETYSDEAQAFLTLVARIREGANTQAESIMKRFGWDVVPTEVDGVTIEMAERLVDKVQALNADNALTERLRAVYEVRENKPFQAMENYVMASKYADKTYAEDEMLDVDHSAGRASKEVPQGFTIAREPDIRLTPRTDFFALVGETLEAQLWYIHMQPAIDNVYEVVNSRDYRDHAGQVVSTYWKEYLTLVANKGSKQGTARMPFLRDLKRNLTRAILGFKLTTMLIQPTSGLNAALYVGMKYDAEAAGKIMAELAKAYVVPSYKKESLANSEALRLRAGSAGSIDLYELQQMAEKGLLDDKNRFQKAYNFYQTASMAGIQEIDIRTAAAVRNGMYEYFLSRGMSEEKAGQEADFIMTLTQSSTQNVDQPMILAEHGDLGKFLFIFQTFTLGLWSMMYQGIFRAGLIRGDMSTKVKALGALITIPIIASIAQEMTKMVNDLIRGKEDDEDLEEKFHNAITNSWVELVGAVPILGNIAKSAILYKRGYTHPLLDQVTTIFTGTQKIMEGKELHDKLKGVATTAEALAVLVGVAGSKQLFDFIDGFLKDENAKKNAVIAHHAKQYVKGEQSFSKRQQAFDALVAELYPPESVNDMTNAQYNSLMKNFLRKVVLVGDNKEAEAIAKLTKNEDKAMKLLDYKETMDSKKFNELVNYLYDYEIITKDVEKKMLELKYK